MYNTKLNFSEDLDVSALITEGLSIATTTKSENQPTLEALPLVLAIIQAQEQDLVWWSLESTFKPNNPNVIHLGMEITQGCQVAWEVPVSFRQVIRDLKIGWYLPTSPAQQYEYNNATERLLQHCLGQDALQKLRRI